MKRSIGQMSREALELISLGCHHEEQHQELLLTDLLHLLAQNPLAPAFWPPTGKRPEEVPLSLQWIKGKQGPVSIGHDGTGFSFDCEGPRHATWPAPHALADRLITNAEWLSFVDDGGYRAVGNWLSDGWAWVKQNEIEAPSIGAATRKENEPVSLGSMVRSRSIRRPRSSMSVSSRQTPSHAGWARACRRKRNGRAPRRPSTNRKATSLIDPGR